MHSEALDRIAFIQRTSHGMHRRVEVVGGKFVSYLRVSTVKQGASGLGLEAQRQAVAAFVNGGKGSLVAEVQEIESGKRDDRPKLLEALALCRLHEATLLIAKLDRLSRDAHSSLDCRGPEFAL